MSTAVSTVISCSSNEHIICAFNYIFFEQCISSIFHVWDIGLIIKYNRSNNHYNSSNNSSNKHKNSSNELKNSSNEHKNSLNERKNSLNEH